MQPRKGRREADQPDGQGPCRITVHLPRFARAVEHGESPVAAANARAPSDGYDQVVPAHPLVYLTGAPATGKTSVADYLRTTYGARPFSYGQELRDHASLRGISHEELRDQSSKVVTAKLIAELDASLPTLLAGWREEGPVVIDSHAVTSETWGLRALPYNADALSAIGITHIICLIADGETLLERIRATPEGRRADDPWKLEQLNNTQLALAAAYTHTLGIGLFAIDARASREDVCRGVASRCGLVP
jgi:adenylate kinase